MVLDGLPAVQGWNEEESSDESSDVLDALQRYSIAETMMFKRVRGMLGMGETDLAAVRFAMDAAARGDQITPTDLKNHLGVTMASVTVMIDRLERSGHLERRMDAQDRRRRLVSATDLADEQVGAALEVVRQRMSAAVAGMTRTQVDTVAAFLARAERAVAGTVLGGSTD